MYSVSFCSSSQFESDVATRLRYIMQPALPGDLNYIFFCSSRTRRLRLPTAEAPIHSARQRERIIVDVIERIAFSLSLPRSIDDVTISKFCATHFQIPMRRTTRAITPVALQKQTAVFLHVETRNAFKCSA